MKKTAYLTRATQKFLEGTNCKSSIQAVEQGMKTLSDWIDAISLEQEIEAAQLETRRVQHKASRNYRLT
jgi:hypothetical protein